MSYTPTGVFATTDEVAEMQKLQDEAQSTPVMLIAGVDLSASARDRMFRRVYDIALSHGLPEIAGYYGIDLKTGEFVSP